MVGGRPGDDVNAPDSQDKVDLREAYERGRRDERGRRRRHPIGMTFTFAAALVGVAILALALVNGSFGRAGEVVDQQLTIARPMASQAASDAGDQLRHAADKAGSKVADAR